MRKTNGTLMSRLLSKGEKTVIWSIVDKYSRTDM